MQLTALKQLQIMEFEINNEKRIHTNPLVSIIVITYNSSEYVLETLESAKVQTYPNIELIISDDCSTDDTVEICRKWLEKNKERFVRTELITVEKNAGVSANCNRGLYASKGEWLKYIAGDDLLIDKCISLYIGFITRFNDSMIVHSSAISKNKNNETRIIKPKKHIVTSSQKKQYKFLLKDNWILAPTTFINRNILIQNEGFNIKYRMIEDYPLWIKLFQENIQFSYLDEPTVIYRENPTSLTNNMIGSSRKQYIISYLRVYRDLVYKELLKNGLFVTYLNIKLEHIVLKAKIFNKRNLDFLLYLRPSNLSKHLHL